MMSRLDKVLQYRRQVDEAHRQVAIAEGKLESALDSLQKDFGCNNIKAAKEKLKSLTVKAKRLEQKTIKKLNAFEGKWKEQLGT